MTMEVHGPGERQTTAWYRWGRSRRCSEEIGEKLIKANIIIYVLLTTIRISVEDGVISGYDSEYLAYMKRS